MKTTWEQQMAAAAAPPDTRELRRALAALGYDAGTARLIAAQALAYGTLELCHDLRPGDRAAADAAFERGQPAVPWDDWGWEAAGRDWRRIGAADTEPE